MLNTRRRGFVLPFVLILGAMLSIAAMSFFRKLESSAQVTADTVGRKRAFYAADGLGRAIVRRAANYTSSVASPDVTGLRAAVSTTFVDSILPPGFARDGAFTLNLLGGSAPGPLPSGPFAGMQAKQQNVEFSLKIRDNVTKSAGFTNQTVSLAQVSMFQFFLFVDMPLAGTWLTPSAQWMGRMHVNGDVCLGTSGTFDYEWVTASNRILSGDRTAQCLMDYNSGSTRIRNAANTNWTALTSANDHIGSGASWLSNSATNWGSHAQDVTHQVPVLKVPTVGAPVAQAGRDQDGTLKSNATTSRFLVDPPRVDNSGTVLDSVDILGQKFACKADIRIINGTWFLKPAAPADDCGWPGTPIWSDHPGNLTTAAGLNTPSGGIEGAGINVGQAQIHAATPRPTKYSYYETDAAHEIVGNADGVISYGPIMHNGTKQVPAFVHLRNDGMSCAAGTGNCLCKQDSNGTNWGLSSTVRLGDATALINGVAGQGCRKRIAAEAPTTLTVAEQLIQGTRSGFNDPRVAKDTAAATGRILPINFDVAGFAAALTDTTGSELGATLAAAGRTFNGVVYITAGWNNAQTEYGTASLAPLWPNQGGIADANQMDAYGSGLTNEALPYPLCSGSRNDTHNIVASGAFRHHACGTAGMGTPNAVRVINGASLSTATFPKGLTIATNLPMYLLGNYNTSSDTSTAVSTPWVPSLLAADSFTALSNLWVDTGNDIPWSATPGSFTGRTPNNTTQNTCILSGWVGPTASNNGGLNNFPRYLEDWGVGTVDHDLKGSMVLAFYSVYGRQVFPGHGTGSWAYQAPQRNWAFDPHLNAISNQPPGAPVFTVSATKRWARE